MACPICFDEVSDNITLVQLDCQHSLCSNCLDILRNYSNSCPICRCSINQSNLSLNSISEKPRRLNMTFPSPKGTSIEVSDYELIRLKRVFGDFDPIELGEINIGNKILLQNYLNNCWWYGSVLSINDNRIKLGNCIYNQRSNGLIYKATPSVRNIEYSNRDKFMILSQNRHS